MKMTKFSIPVALWILCLQVAACSASVVQMTESNSKSIIESSKLSFVNFYADWCRFSQALSPVIDEVADTLKAEFPDNAQLIIGRVDCQIEKDLAKNYGVMKFPTMKLFRYGQIQRREYRGQRTAESIIAYIKSQMLETLQILAAPMETAALPLEAWEGAMLGRFDGNQSTGFAAFQRVADQLRDECRFIAVIGSKTEPDRVAFLKGPDPASQINLAIIEEASIRRVVQENCVSVVRELTFENAEEITEEGNPMFILFYRADDSAIVEKYKAAVEKNLKQYSDRVSFLYGQGPLFIRALRQLRKTVNDLPLLAIDSFQHMYQFPHDARDSIDNYTSRLAAFIEDLTSGKLHTDYHKSENGGDGPAAMAKEPPVSVFRRLSPSASRYSFSKEEL